MASKYESLLSFRRKEAPVSNAVPGLVPFSPDQGTDTYLGPLGFDLLSTPVEPIIDIILVHGLGGGSRKTWSKSNLLTHFWPKEWLAKDPAFKDARIHTYGYNSDWIKARDNCLNLHHMGKSLLAEMSVYTHLQTHALPIVFIGHSMGGLVMKKALILAKQDATYSGLASRIRSMYFLATPHRGADSAKLLNNVLQLTSSSRDYIADLQQNSRTIQSINDEYRNYVTGMELWSFYETQKLRIGLISTLIVEPEAAVLGYPGEKQMPLNADHRSICKYEDPTDPNYVFLRNALAATVREHFQPDSVPKTRRVKTQMKEIERYLGVLGDEEDELASILHARVAGTCRWLQETKAFLKWSSFGQGSPKMLFLTGHAATGKTMLAASVIDALRENHSNCSYYFFKHGDRAKSRLSSCLKSLAYQMALENEPVRQVLQELQIEGAISDRDSDRTIWRALFTNGVFRTTFKPGFWVIDALDECSNLSYFLDEMLAKVDDRVPLKILITTRDNSDLENQISALDPHKLEREIVSKTSTLPDISLLVKDKVGTFQFTNNRDRDKLMEKVLDMSQGSFLWTTLVLDELRGSFGEEEISKVLDTIPQSMVPLYERTLGTMMSMVGSRRLTQALLAWTTCAARPLTIQEMKGALHADLNDQFIRLEESIVALCGQFISVDRLGHVRLIHETAREFLLTTRVGCELSVNKIDANTRIARSCLVYLTGHEMKPPRTQRKRPLQIPAAKGTEFAAYACFSFSYHLARADPQSSEVMMLLESFLKFNIFSWIETVARSGNLNPLIRAAKDLKRYHDSCTVARSPLGRSMHTIRNWASDLVRIVAKFADPLVSMPTAIHALICPFCPTSSVIHKSTNAGKRLIVAGHTIREWGDRLSCLDFRERQASAVCYGEDYLAVGLATGTVILYHAISCLEIRTLQHCESVRILQFKDKSSLLASCGMKAISVFDVVRGETLYEFHTYPRILGLSFDGGCLIAASSRNHLKVWDLDAKGLELADRPWNMSGALTATELRLTPNAISISVQHKMLAIAFSQQPIVLWDLEEDAFYGYTGKRLADGEPSRRMLVTALLFNSNPNLAFLAASYLDGELVTLDVFDDKELASSRAQCAALASSPDGRLLAGGAPGGIVRVYEFDTLRLLYSVKSSNVFIKRLVFNREGSRLADVRGAHCNIWEPPFLFQDFTGDASSEATLSPVEETIEGGTLIKITQLAVHPEGRIIFGSKDDGSISCYDAQSGVELRTLYNHKSRVSILAIWPEGRIITSVDTANRAMTWSIGFSHKEGYVAESLMFSSRLDSQDAIIQITPGEAVGKIIFSTRSSDHLWTIKGREDAMRPRTQDQGSSYWTRHPRSAEHIMQVRDPYVHIYTWKDWSEIAIVNLAEVLESTSLMKVFLANKQENHCRKLFESSNVGSFLGSRCLYLMGVGVSNIEKGPYELGQDPTEPTQVSLHRQKSESTIGFTDSQLSKIASRMVQIIGLVNDRRMVYLDTRSWVCSVDLEQLGHKPTAYHRHFFMPYDWLAGTKQLLCAVSGSNLCFGVHNQIVVVRGWLDCGESVDLHE